MEQPVFHGPEATAAIARGDVRGALELTGSPYFIRGLVVHGNHLGRTLGFPTANLKLHPDTPFMAANGVYAVWTEWDHFRYPGMLNAGFRPTIDGKTRTIEVNLFNFTGDLYDVTLTVIFAERIRDEKKFGSLEELTEQLTKDREKAMLLLA